MGHQQIPPHLIFLSTNSTWIHISCISQNLPTITKRSKYSQNKEPLYTCSEQATCRGIPWRGRHKYQTHLLNTTPSTGKLAIPNCNTGGYHKPNLGNLATPIRLWKLVISKQTYANWQPPYQSQAIFSTANLSKLKIHNSLKAVFAKAILCKLATPHNSLQSRPMQIGNPPLQKQT